MSEKLIRAIEGTRDYFDETGARFAQAMRAATTVFARYGYRKIVTPIFESTPLFARSIGEATDIVEKEMYTFQPGSDQITLRPEGTAGVVRAYLQHNLHKQGGLTKLWYDGPMFRRERPQKGRQRQFHQVGVEALGANDPLLDAETISMGMAYYAEVGIAGVNLRLNSIGCPDPACRPAYRETLRKAIEPHLPSLCKSCQTRYEKNVLRILDCKREECKKIAAGLPASSEHLCEPCAHHFFAVRGALDSAGVAYAVDKTLVRGLDYYTKTVFEYTHGALGAQDAIGGGGRYDGLVETLGGPATPAVGFAIGIERVMIALEAAGIGETVPVLDVYAIGLGDTARAELARILQELRAAGYAANMDYEGRSFKAQMRAANREGAQVALILGDDELAAGQIQIKDMREGGGQSACPLGDVIAQVRALLTES